MKKPSEGNNIRIGNVWMNEIICPDYRPHIVMGCWDSPDSAIITLEHVKQMRRFLTNTIIKIQRHEEI